jgi:hypothetical protein
MTNNRGSGKSDFQSFGADVLQSQPLTDIALLDSFKGADYWSGSVNCRTVEFVLKNDTQNQNQADFDLMAKPENNYHVF